MKVADIQAGSLDSAGTIIEEVYTKYDPNYAVYRTKSRVLVQFGDLEETEKSQRAALATLYPLRGEVNGLIDGWRGSKDATRAAKARRYERRAADALVVALEASPADGALLLQSVKADLIDGRQATGRVQYLATALATALACLILLGLGSLIWSLGFTKSYVPMVRLLWLASAAGVAGAIFSVALGIRGRTIQTDLMFRNNATDAALRIAIGLVSGPVLICALFTKAVSFTLGDLDLSKTADPNTWPAVIILAFAAGFSERLVGDLLAKAATKAIDAPPPSETIPAKTAPLRKDATVLPTADISDQRPPIDPETIDGCACGSDHDPTAATADADLPPAIGG